MSITPQVKKILDNYESDNPGTKANLARILMQGRLGGTGKLVILPVDQGFEHGPARSFAANPVGYDPHYHHSLAIEAGLSAYATPLGMMEASSGTFAGQIPTILKVNSSNSLATSKEAPSQAITGSVSDALRLGCSAIGFTIYPGSDAQFEMMEQIREMAEEAKAVGPHGGTLGRPHHQGEAADRRARAGRRQDGLREAEDRHLDPGQAL
jgi:class I fructose-bisphosphate aldolase